MKNMPKGGVWELEDNPHKLKAIGRDGKEIKEYVEGENTIIETCGYKIIGKTLEQLEG